MPTAISARIAPVPAMYQLLMGSQKWGKALLPQGLISSPYEVLDYDATLTIFDAHGCKATFNRTQQVRFLQQGVEAIMDHAWGDGVLVTNYHHSAGLVKDSFKDQGYRHLIVGLKRPMSKGEILKFSVERKAMVGFLKSEEWLETRVDHPIDRLRRTILFPKDRPCQRAVLEIGAAELVMPIIQLLNGQTLVRFTIVPPTPGTPYIIRWSW